MNVFVPGTSREFNELFKKTWNIKAPKYFKLSTKEHSRNEIVCEPYDIVIVKKSTNNKKLVIVTGHLLDEVLDAEIDCTIIYCSTLTKLNADSNTKLIDLVNSHQELYTVEENSIVGGLGDFIFQILSESTAKMPNKFKKIGIPLNWLTNYGSAQQPIEALGLTIHGIKEKSCGS